MERWMLNGSSVEMLHENENASLMMYFETWDWKVLYEITWAAYEQQYIWVSMYKIKW